MILKNTLIFQGNYSDIKSIRDELNTFLKNKKHSRFYNEKTTKYIKKLKMEEEKEYHYDYRLKITFLYSKNNLEELVQTFETPQVTLAYMCENDKKNIWIVNNNDYIREYQLIPDFAIHNILFDYMQYKESAIILDTFETIKYDRNVHEVVVNDKKLSYDELIDIIFNKTIKGKLFYDIIEEFINNYHEKCINRYDELYSNNKEHIHNEEPSPLGLFIVTFGILGIIFVLVKLMGYI